MTEKVETNETLAARLREIGAEFERELMNARDCGGEEAAEYWRNNLITICRAVDAIDQLRGHRKTRFCGVCGCDCGCGCADALTAHAGDARQSADEIERLAATVARLSGVYGTSLAKDTLEAALTRAEQAEARATAAEKDRDDWKLAFETSNEHVGKLDAERARLLARVRELPTPVNDYVPMVFASGAYVYRTICRWCGAHWSITEERKHRDDCLWVEAVSGPSDTPATE